MLVLGLETSCDDSGVGLYEVGQGLLAHRTYSQVSVHAPYGGVVPELASRDHIRRLLPLVQQVMGEADRSLSELTAVAYTRGPGLAGALLVGASVGSGLALALGIRALGIHHLEGHLLSPLLSQPAPGFPFVALLVSGGHTQLMHVAGVGRYALLGDTLDDAAGEAFDKTAKLLGLGYPGGPALARLAALGQSGRIRLPRPLLGSSDLNFSFSGLKTAVAVLVRENRGSWKTEDVAAEFQEAVVEVLVHKALMALAQSGSTRLVVAGGVGANSHLRERLRSACTARGAEVYFPPPELCTDNGAMIAYAGALRLQGRAHGSGSDCDAPHCREGFGVQPRWDLQQVSAPDSVV
jgi:N6-L-threonylcarbamoyladenine synthase